MDIFQALEKARQESGRMITATVNGQIFTFVFQLPPDGIAISIADFVNTNDVGSAETLMLYRACYIHNEDGTPMCYKEHEGRFKFDLGSARKIWGIRTHDREFLTASDAYFEEMEPGINNEAEQIEEPENPTIGGQGES